jgi:subtilase family serine protease
MTISNLPKPESFITSIDVSNYTSINDSPYLSGPKVAAAYGIPSGTGANVKVGIISLGGGFSQADLNRSMTDLGLPNTQVTFVGVDGATNNYTGNYGGADGENALDLVCVASMVPQANVVLYMANNNTSLTYANWVNVFQRAVNEGCDVITHSWGQGEHYRRADFLSAPLNQAAANGITVFVSAGDYGSTASQYDTFLEPTYPATNANVIAVGGTQLTVFSGNSQRYLETVYNNSESGMPSGFGGGGGISTFIPVPSWQANLKYQKYFTANSTVSSPQQLTGRGIPDMSAAMNSYGVWIGSTLYGFSGTSASAPIMAGMMARFISMMGKRPTPGSIQPLMYTNNVFVDITEGNNASDLVVGYSATAAWDPATGLGIPDGNAFYRILSPSGARIKTSANTWSYVSSVKVKTATNTWSNVQTIWTKVDSTTWKQTF